MLLAMLPTNAPSLYALGGERSDGILVSIRISTLILNLPQVGTRSVESRRRLRLYRPRDRKQTKKRSITFLRPETVYRELHFYIEMTMRAETFDTTQQNWTKTCVK